jgi:2'-5' RNA ligase
VRLFFAANVTPEIRERLALVQRPLVATGADVKWVEIENLHVTMKFLGEVPEDKVPAIVAQADQAAKEAKAFVMSLGGLGAFPTQRAPRVVWVGLTHGLDELRVLARGLEAGLEKLGFKPEGRPFSAHVTLGRVRSPRGRDALAQALQAGRECEIGTLNVEKFALMQSVLGRGGPQYSVVQEFRLGAQ